MSEPGKDYAHSVAASLARIHLSCGDLRSTVVDLILLAADALAALEAYDQRTGWTTPGDLMERLRAAVGGKS